MTGLSETAGTSGSALTYPEALAFLESALAFGVHPSLDGIRALTAGLDSPQDAFAAVQVTGTNGKTSVTRATAALLTAHGERTGVYTSPHLVDYTERMAIDGVPVSRDAFASAIAAVLAVADECMVQQALTLGLDVAMLDEAFTEFELLTAAALWLFARERCSWACLEVGMGGRWDSTSVVAPRVAVVTGVGLDHTQRLGSTREAIATDKSHIIKPGSVAVMGPGCGGVEGIILKRAEAVGAPVVRVAPRDAGVTWTVREKPSAPGGITRLDVSGRYATYPALEIAAPSYQAPNIACALAAAEVALGHELQPDAARAVLRELRFPGRFELLGEHPPLVIDGAHNPQAARVLADAIGEAFGDRRPAIVLSILADKDAAGIVAELARVASMFVITRNSSPRARECDELAALVAEMTGVTPLVVPEPGLAVQRARELSDAGVVVTGSLYTAGQVRHWWETRGPERF